MPGCTARGLFLSPPEGIPPMTRPVEKLDRSRNYGTVHGDVPNNMKFTQRAMGLEDWPYDAHGDLIVDALTAAQRAKLDEKRTQVAKAPKAEPVDDEREP